MSKKSILVVDDEVEIRDLLKNILEGLGHIITTAQDGKEALKLLRSEYYDIVILDNQMPNMSGEELLIEYSSEKPGNQKIIYCTGKSLSLMKLIDDNHLFICVDTVLNKPFNVAKLKDIIDEVL